MENIYIPQEDVNSDGATICEIFKKNLDKIKIGEVIASVETTKAVFDIVSENEGYIMLNVKVKDFVKYNQPIAIISKNKKELDAYSINKKNIPSKDKLNSKFTKKAIQLAQQKGVDITKIKSKKIITENDILKMINKNSPINSESDDIIIKPGILPKGLNRIMILGGGLGAMQVIDILLNEPTNQIVGILDDNPDLINTDIFGISVLGSTNEIKKYWDKKFFDKAIISISTNIPIRKSLYEKSKKLKIPFANAICPSTRINRHLSIGEGNVICSLTHIGTCSSIGNNNFISAQTNIEHHNVWGSHITTGPNCNTSSRVKIDDCVKFGMGIFIQPGISVGENCLISSGSVITKSINSNHAVKTKLSSEIKPI